MFKTYNYFRQHNSGQEISDYKNFYRKFSNDREFGGDFTHLDHLVKNRFMDMWGHIFNVILRKQPKNILDIGCGLGVNLPFSKVFSNIDYHGLDYAEKSIEKARSVYPNVNFHVGDAFNMEFDDASFDMCVLSSVLILYSDEQDQLNLLTEVNRVLAKDGVFALIVWNESFMLKKSIQASRIIGKLMGQDLPEDFMGIHFKNKEIRSLVYEAGMRVDQIYNTGHHYGVLESVRYLNMSKYNRNFGASESESLNSNDQSVLQDLISQAGKAKELTMLFYFISKLFPSLFSMFSIYVCSKKTDR